MTIFKGKLHQASFNNSRELRSIFKPYIAPEIDGMCNKPELNPTALPLVLLFFITS